MAKVNKRKKVKNSFVVLVFCLVINAVIMYSIGSIFTNVYYKNKEKQQLNDKLVLLKEQGEALRVEAKKLQDPEYVARYAREKYLYSGEDEYVIRIP